MCVRRFAVCCVVMLFAAHGASAAAAPLPRSVLRPARYGDSCRFFAPGDAPKIGQVIDGTRPALPIIYDIDIVSLEQSRYVPQAYILSDKERRPFLFLPRKSDVLPLAPGSTVPLGARERAVLAAHDLSIVPCFSEPWNGIYPDGTVDGSAIVPMRVFASMPERVTCHGSMETGDPIVAEDRVGRYIASIAELRNEKDVTVGWIYFARAYNGSAAEYAQGTIGMSLADRTALRIRRTGSRLTSVNLLREVPKDLTVHRCVPVPGE